MMKMINIPSNQKIRNTITMKTLSKLKLNVEILFTNENNEFCIAKSSTEL